MLSRLFLLSAIFSGFSCVSRAPKPAALGAESGAAGSPAAADHGEWADRQRYVAYSTGDAPKIDGHLTEAAWRDAQPTAQFVDIQGEALPAPRFATTAKMLWDRNCFYIGAQCEDPHLWATLTERDSVVFEDNDFEVFIDPDGDTHHYYELEVNLLGTEWDLLLVKPYRDGGPAVNAFDTLGLRTAVSCAGTLNDPTDVDEGWSIEIAIPWSALAQIADRPLPPNDGDIWWVNFSRVQWWLDVVQGESGSADYVKRTDDDGKLLPEENWVWSPQGVIAMHEPESWGLVMFAEESEAVRSFVDPSDLLEREFLFRLYRAQARFRREHKEYSESLAELGVPFELEGAHALSIKRTEAGYLARLWWKDAAGEHELYIDASGHLRWL